jgi:hypothetical protein
MNSKWDYTKLGDYREEEKREELDSATAQSSVVDSVGPWTNRVYWDSVWSRPFRAFSYLFLFSIILLVSNLVIHTYFSHLIIKCPSCNLKWGVVTFFMNHYKILEESRSYHIYLHIYVIKCLVDPFNCYHISKFN